MYNDEYNSAMHLAKICKNASSGNYTINRENSTAVYSKALQTQYTPMYNYGIVIHVYGTACITI